MGVSVSRVVIYNRNDGSHAVSLSNSVVSVINYEGTTLVTYRIGNATNIPVFNIYFDTSKLKPTAQPTNPPTTLKPTAQPTHPPTTLKPTAQPTNPPTALKLTASPTSIPTASPSNIASLVHKVRVQLDGRNFLHMREVQVYDMSGVNRALNKPAIQSSTFAVGLPASKAVNGDLNDFSCTFEEAGNTMNGLNQI